MDNTEQPRFMRVPESLWARRTLWASLIFFPAIFVTMPLAIAQILKDKQRGALLLLWALLISIGQVIVLLGLIWAVAFWLKQNPMIAEIFTGLI